MTNKVERIRTLNDQLRQHLPCGTAVMMRNSDDCDHSFQRIATSVTRVRDVAVGCCF
jgi:hypothetical protein